MFIRSPTTTLLQIFCEISLCSQVIFKSMKVADVRFWRALRVNGLTLHVDADMLPFLKSYGHSSSLRVDP